MCTVGSISDSEPQENAIMDLWRLPLSDPLSIAIAAFTHSPLATSEAELKRKCFSLRKEETEGRS